MFTLPILIIGKRGKELHQTVVEAFTTESGKCRVAVALEYAEAILQIRELAIPQLIIITNLSVSGIPAHQVAHDASLAVMSVNRPPPIFIILHKEHEKPGGEGFERVQTRFISEPEDRFLLATLMEREWQTAHARRQPPRSLASA